MFNLRGAIAIGLGAIAGAISRYLITLWLTQKIATSFPVATLSVNALGCLGMGIFAALSMEQAAFWPPEIKLLISVGFLGSFTTFSTYELDTIGLMQEGHVGRAIACWLGSATLGAISLYGGILLVRYFR
ncbi:MAG: fluoride efflux transporter CrcB [Cyanobacteria bacterium P01_F01_bin.150]